MRNTLELKKYINMNHEWSRCSHKSCLGGNIEGVAIIIGRWMKKLAASASISHPKIGARSECIRCGLRGGVVGVEATPYSQQVAQLDSAFNLTGVALE